MSQSINHDHWQWKKMIQRGGITAVSLLLFLLALAATGSTPVHALSTTTVTTTVVKDNPADGNCDLWEALQAIADFNNGSNSDGDGDLTTYHECTTGAGPHAIIFAGSAAAGTITLPTNLYNRPFSGLPFVTDDVTITGPVVIDGGGESINAHIFITNAGGKLTLVNMVVQNGYSSGGGGAILSLGGSDIINILTSSFQNNNVAGNGGAINAVGQVNILASNFSGNKALGTDGPWGDAQGAGGAIYVTGYNSLNISLSNFAGNIATEGGGAIYTGADSGEITDTVFNGNIVDDDAPNDDTDGGGAIYNFSNDSDSSLTIVRSAFNGNLSFDAPGGAIYNASDGYLHMRDSSLNGNIAGTLSNEEMGGGIYNQEVLDIRRVMFLGNVASLGNGGAVANDRTGVGTFANVTFTANGAPDGYGGAIWNGNTQTGGPASYVYLYNSTLALNASQNDGAAIFNQTDGNHETILANTIVDGIPVVDSCNEGLTSQGHNIDSGTTCGLNQSSDQSDTDPGLEALDFNGGPLVSLLTHALEPGSAAIDAGDNSVCGNDYVENLDGRSDPRPKGITCDVGAYETDPLVAGFGSDPLPPGPVVIGTTSIGVSITNTLTIISVGNTELEVDNPQIIGGDADEFEVLTPFPVSTSFQEEIVLRCQATAVGNFSTSFTFTTNVPDVPVVSFELQCNVNPAPTPGFASDPAAPGPLDYGEVEVGETADLSLTFMETGNATLILGPIGITGTNPFDFTFNAFDTTINDGEPPVDLPITCQPTGFGPRTATVILQTNDPLQPSVTYALICEGVAPPPDHLDYPGLSYIDGQGGINSLDGAYDVAVSPDGLNVYVTSYNDDSLTVFLRDAATGALEFGSSTSNLDMDGPFMVEVSPDGTQVYVTAGISDSFLIYTRIPGTGLVILEDVWTDGDGGGIVTGLDYAYGITVSPDGRFIYVTGFNSDAVVTFYRDEDGFVGYDNTITHPTYLDAPYIPTLSPDGKHLYVTGGGTAGNPDDGYITVYERNVLDGSLAFVQHRYEGELIGCSFICFYIHGLSSAWGVVVSPDGNHVYVVGYQDDALVRFIRDPFDGKLTFGGYMTNSLLEPAGQGRSADSIEAEGLDGALDVKISPDGAHVYVTGYLSDALTVFERNEETGILNQVQALYPSGGLPALDGAREISVSPDGTAVYATGSNSDAVVAFHTANPIATLSNLLPASAVAGGPEFTLRVQGENFVPGATVRVNGANRQTTFINPTELEADILASDITSAGTFIVDVVTPAPGGGASLNDLTFTITPPNENPIPSIDYLTPQGANGGDPAFTLAVLGTNFVNGAVVQWNGNDRTTTFISSNEVHAQITAEDLLSPGAAAITVINPSPGGGTSNTAIFEVTAPGQNPTPTILSIDPTFANARGAASDPVVVHVTGQNFMLESQGQWNGENRPTQFVSETELMITLNSLDVAFGGSGAITVVNPAPGGGTSNPATFTVYAYTLMLPIVIR